MWPFNFKQTAAPTDKWGFDIQQKGTFVMFMDGNGGKFREKIEIELPTKKLVMLEDALRRTKAGEASIEIRDGYGSVLRITQDDTPQDG